MKKFLKLAATRAAKIGTAFTAMLIAVMCIFPMTAFASDETLTGSRASIPDDAVADTASRAATDINWLTGSLIVAVGLLVIGIIIYLVWKNGQKHKEDILKAGFVGGDNIAGSLGLGRNAANNQYGVFTPVVPVAPQAGTPIQYGALNQQQAPVAPNNPYFQQPPAPQPPQQQPPQNNNPWR
jgi:hypothetical protein